MKANIGHTTGVEIDKDIALKMMNWHDSGSDPIYAAGSTAFAGHLPSPSVVADALEGFKKMLPDAKKRKYGWGKSEVKELESIIEHLEVAIEYFTDDLVRDIETASTMIANEDAVESLTYLDDQTLLDLGDDLEPEDVWFIAEAGDAVGVNGDLAYGAEGEPSLHYGDEFLAQQAVKPPKGFVETNYGGWAGGQYYGIREDTLSYVLKNIMEHEAEDPYVEEVINQWIGGNSPWESDDATVGIWVREGRAHKKFLQ